VGLPNKFSSAASCSETNDRSSRDAWCARELIPLIKLLPLRFPILGKDAGKLLRLPLVEALLFVLLFELFVLLLGVVVDVLVAVAVWLGVLGGVDSLNVLKALLSPLGLTRPEKLGTNEPLSGLFNRVSSFLADSGPTAGSSELLVVEPKIALNRSCSSRTRSLARLSCIHCGTSSTSTMMPTLRAISRCSTSIIVASLEFENRSEMWIAV